jgi:hypothetical protein
MRRVRKFITTTMLLLLCAGSSFAQDAGERLLRIEVADGAGQPVARACVTIVPREGEIIFRKADSRGRVKVKGLAPGSYRVVVKSDGYEAQKREVVVDSNGENVAFSLSPRKL